MESISSEVMNVGSKCVCSRRTSQKLSELPRSVRSPLEDMLGSALQHGMMAARDGAAETEREKEMDGHTHTEKDVDAINYTPQVIKTAVTDLRLFNCVLIQQQTELDSLKRKHFLSLSQNMIND